MKRLDAVEPITSDIEGKKVHAHIDQHIKTTTSDRESIFSHAAKMIPRQTEIALSARPTTEHSGGTASPVFIRSLFKQGKVDAGLQILEVLQKQGLYADCRDAYVFLLHQCKNSEALSLGKKIHAHIDLHIKTNNSTLKYTLFCMYAKCGSLIDARAVFDQMGSHNVVVWTFMINEYVKRGLAIEAILLFHRMTQEGVSPNHVTYLCVLKACTHLGIMIQGKRIHVNICRILADAEILLGNALIDMYAKCGNIEVAQIEFNKLNQRTIVSWNSLIAGYVKNNEFEKAFRLYLEMKGDGIEPDAVTFLSIIKVCASEKDLVHGRLAHSGILAREFEVVKFVENALVDMYCKCEFLEDARKVFKQINRPHVGAWNALINGYAELGYPEQAVQMFNEMKVENIELGKVTFLGALKACSALAAMTQGSEIHGLIRKQGLELDLFVASNLVDMYAKCGNLEEAQKLFDKMLNHSLVTWNTLIAAYALHGRPEEAFKLSWRMEEEMNLNHVTFVGLLFACSHGGLVEEGWKCFDSMSRAYGHKPLVEHYCCLVDILSRAGCLDDSFYVVGNMPFEPNAAIWKAFLGACRVCYDTNFARCVMDSLEPQDNATFVLVSNIFAAGSGWEVLNNDSEV